MVLTAVLQVSTVLVAVLTLVWHQTRTVDRLRKEVRGDHNHLLKLHAKATRQARKDNEKLRRDFTEANSELRRDFTEANSELRREFTEANSEMRREFTEANSGLASAYNKLWDAIVHNSRKLDRIEGFLGIGMPEPVADRAPGAALRASHPTPADSPEASRDALQEPRPQEPQSQSEADSDG
ncbi:MAG: hypothetical protein OXC06_10820 [Acidimicrobiaceae bacterium]|nr:hypothetical protein [Acidimicrobiaceae bacterium]